jgi:hypothetical protein
MDPGCCAAVGLGMEIRSVIAVRCGFILRRPEWLDPVGRELRRLYPQAFRATVALLLLTSLSPLLAVELSGEGLQATTDTLGKTLTDADIQTAWDAAKQRTGDVLALSGAAADDACFLEGVLRGAYAKEVQEEYGGSNGDEGRAKYLYIKWRAWAICAAAATGETNAVLRLSRFFREYEHDQGGKRTVRDRQIESGLLVLTEVPEGYPQRTLSGGGGVEHVRRGFLILNEDADAVVVKAEIHFGARVDTHTITFWRSVVDGADYWLPVCIKTTVGIQ